MFGRLRFNILLMCITRVAKVLSVKGNRAVVSYPGRERLAEIDVSMVHVRKNSYVETFADTALKTVNIKEAKERWKLSVEVWGTKGRTNF